MKANELRIGNLFIDKYSKQPMKVLELLRSGNIVFDIECFGRWQAEPIPLTEQWIKKLGFELKYKDMTIGLVKGCYILESSFLPNNKKWIFRKITDVENSYALKEIEYVHQLQNLYFALTERELTRVDG